jgi:hypothetical protein
MVAVVVAFAVVVATVKEVVEAPAGMVTLAGTVARALLLVRVTVVAEGAAPVKLTVPWAGFPPTTVVGLRARALSIADGCGVQPARVARAELVLEHEGGILGGGLNGDGAGCELEGS